MRTRTQPQYLLWENIVKNLPTLMALAALIGFVYVLVFRVENIEKAQASQQIEIDTVQNKYWQIAEQLTKIQTTLDESIKPDLSTIKKDIKELESKRQL